MKRVNSQSLEILHFSLSIYKVKYFLLGSIWGIEDRVNLGPGCGFRKPRVNPRKRLYVVDNTDLLWSTHPSSRRAFVLSRARTADGTCSPGPTPVVGRDSGPKCARQDKSPIGKQTKKINLFMVESSLLSILSEDADGTSPRTTTYALNPSPSGPPPARLRGPGRTGRPRPAAAGLRTRRRTRTAHALRLRTPGRAEWNLQKFERAKRRLVAGRRGARREGRWGAVAALLSRGPRVGGPSALGGAGCARGAGKGPTRSGAARGLPGPARTGSRKIGPLRLIDLCRPFGGKQDPDRRP